MSSVLAHQPDIRVSFEFFPPNSEAMEETLWNSIKRLEPIAPSFVSVTYGAGGSTRERTHRTVTRILQETSLKPASHLTCVGASRAEVDEVVQRYAAEGVSHIVALRGDAPEGAAQYEPHPQGYINAADLVKGIKAQAPDMEISVACYPEKHPDSADWSQELDNLAAKVEAGATRAISQFFFDPHVFLEFLQRAKAHGITIPIVPGIIPVQNFNQVKRFAEGAGASVPSWLADLYQGLEKDAETRKLVAATVAAEQVKVLRAEGVQDFHFYTLNRADLVFAICHILGLRPQTPADA
ncbi:MAG: methylenetetrahydrofolate reductase [NAD(P)H] [Alphaproteobacteria bacterium]